MALPTTEEYIITYAATIHIFKPLTSTSSEVIMPLETSWLIKELKTIWVWSLFKGQPTYHKHVP